MVGQNAVSDFDGEKLRAARTAAGLSQEELANRINVPRVSIVRWEGGWRRPYASSLAALAAELNVSPAALTTRDVSTSPTLAQLRIAAGLTQQTAAARAHLIRTRYSALERGEIANPSDETINAVAAAFDVTPAQIRTAHAQSRAGHLARS